ncbi:MULTISPECIES: phage tail tube protein [unclassified Glutamicibacter]|uniref:phage tail tube protein n=1 Tax=unclassified Glutamicibacter TaxID=2627139 RepID=UPI0040342D4E
MQNASNVSVGKPTAAGGIFAGPVSTEPPVDARSTLVAGIVGLGYVSEDGLTNTIEADTESITAWGGDTVLTVRTSRAETFGFTFIETNVDVLREVYGPDNVTVEEITGDIAVLHNAKELPSRLYVFEIIMTGDKVKRIVVPNAKINELGDVVYVDGEPIGYEVTLGAFPDAEGNTAYEYIAEIVGA